MIHSLLQSLFLAVESIFNGCGMFCFSGVHAQSSQRDLRSLSAVLELSMQEEATRDRLREADLSIENLRTKIIDLTEQLDAKIKYRQSVNKSLTLLL